MSEEIEIYYKESELPRKISGIPVSVYDILAEGMKNGFLIDLLYEDSLGNREKRRVLPEAIFFWNDDWYVAAFCHLREEERTFRLDRILSVELTGEKEESHGIAAVYREEGIPWLRFDSELEDESPDPDDGDEEILSAYEMEEKALYLDLIRYAEENRVDLIRNVLAVGMNFRLRHNCGTTPLFAAAENGSLDALKLLISSGADPLEKNDAEDTLLFRAAWFSQMEIVRYLTEELHCDPNEKNCHGWTALFAAADHYNCILMKYLLDHGADINCFDAEGKTILMHLLETNGDPEKKMRTFRFLVEMGADPDLLDRDGRGMLFYVVNNAYADGLEYLLRQKNISLEVRDKRGDNLLLSALDYFNEDIFRYPSREGRDYNDDQKKIIRILCESGVDLNGANKFGVVPLMAARGDTFEYLLKRGADPFARTKSGTTVAVCQSNDLRNIDMLAAAGVDLHLRDDSGEDPLMSAKPDLEHIKYYVEKHGFSVNDRNRKQTLLHRAAEFLEVDAVQYLLEHGADIYALNCEGKTAFEQYQSDYPYAYDSDGTEWYLYDLFDEYSNKDFAGIMISCRALDLKTLLRYPKETLSRYVNVGLGWENRTALRIVEEEWSSPARIIPEKNVIEIIDFLVSSGGNPVDDPNDDGHSLLVTCLEMNREDLAEKYLNFWLNQQESSQRRLKKLYEFYSRNSEGQEYFSLMRDFLKKNLNHETA